MNNTISAYDSALFRNIFTSERMRQEFTDRAFVSRCVDTEVALAGKFITPSDCVQHHADIAEAQAALGVIPKDAGSQIKSGCDVDKLDFDRLRKETDIVGYPILPLIRQLDSMIPDDSGRYLHWGATTQDIMDTASNLQMKAGIKIIEDQLNSLRKILGDLSEKYKDTPMAGRTHLQHALPITFGYKIAVYLSSFDRHLERLHQLKPRCLMVQFGGAAGTLASLGSGEDGLNVRKGMADILGLEDPCISWHVARDGVAEIVSFLAVGLPTYYLEALADSLARWWFSRKDRARHYDNVLKRVLGRCVPMLDRLLILYADGHLVQEPFVPHRGASSTMPQKRNPISSEAMLATSKILRNHASLVQDAMVSDFERASGPWHLEWVAVPESFNLCSGALDHAIFALGGLCVDEDRMMVNLNMSKGLIVGEAVMMGIAPDMGRNNAHDVVYEACRDCIEDKTGKSTLYDHLVKRKEVTDKVSTEKLQSLCDPRNYLGASQRMVDAVLERSRGLDKARKVNGVNGSHSNGVYTNGIYTNGH